MIAWILTANRDLSGIGNRVEKTKTKRKRKKKKKKKKRERIKAEGERRVKKKVD